MSLLLQDVVVTSITLAIAVGAIVRVVQWTRPDRSPGCANCSACEHRGPSVNGARGDLAVAHRRDAR
jgi:hypothetical protein